MDNVLRTGKHNKGGGQGRPTHKKGLSGMEQNDIPTSL
jgi:hypothetical protein